MSMTWKDATLRAVFATFILVSAFLPGTASAAETPAQLKQAMVECHVAATAIEAAYRGKARVELRERDHQPWRFRFYHVNDLLTEELDRKRINVMLNDDGTIWGASCDLN